MVLTQEVGNKGRELLASSEFLHKSFGVVETLQELNMYGHVGFFLREKS
jgi:hypothetical protein